MSFGFGRSYRERTRTNAVVLNTAISSIGDESAGGNTLTLISRKGGPGALLHFVMQTGGPWEVRPGDYRPFTHDQGDVVIADSPTANFNSIDYTGSAYQAGDGPLRLTDGGTGLPAGLTEGTDYWVTPVTPGSTRVRFYTSKQLALAAVAGTEEDITTTGAGATPNTIGGLGITSDPTSEYNSLILVKAEGNGQAAGMSGGVIEAPDRLTIVGTGVGDVFKFWFSGPGE